MVEVSDIVDRESLKAWLDARPKETRQADAVAISSRAAMRVMPVYVSRLGRGNWERQVLAKALPLLRSLLTSKATVKFPTQELRHASLLAADATREDNESTTINYSAAAATASAFGASPGFNSSVSAASVFYACSITSGIWEHVISDATMVTTGNFPSDSKLWIGGTSLQVETDWKAACQWLSVNPGHDFWIRWYEAALEGRPLTGDWDSYWQMLHDIALIRNEDWEQGAEHVARLIADIEDRYTYRVSESTRQDAEVLLKSALGRYGFNDLRNLMELLPFAADLKSIQDPETVAAFVQDMDQERREIETFLRVIEREGRALQGAGAILTYFEEILEEASKARQLSELNIAWIIDCGEILQGYSTSQEVLTELGPLSIPFKRTLSNLLDLIHRHFSATILRLAALRDIRSADEANLHALMEDLRRGFELIKDETSGDRIPMAPEALAVFEKLLDETNRLIQREFMATDPQVKSGLRRDIDYRIAQVSVSLRLYLEQAKAPVKAVVDIAKSVAKKKVTKSVEGLVEWVLEFFKNGQA